MENGFSGKSYTAALALVFLFALVLRGICFWVLRDTHIFSTLIGDSELYDLWAREILRSGWLGEKAFFQAPLYPYFLAIVYALFDQSTVAARIIQLLLGSFSCVLIMEVGRIYFSRRIGIISGLLAAAYPMAIYYDLLIQKATFSLFFSALLLLLIAKAAEKKRWIWFALCGVATGFLGMVRENALILVFVILLWLIIRFRKGSLKAVFLWSVALLAGVSLVIFPVALRNRLVSGEFVLLTTNLGFNLFIGNSKDATGTWSSLVPGQGDWRYESPDAKRLAEKAMGRELSDAEVSGYWISEALSSIGEDVPRWLKLVAKKWVLLWNDTELSDTESIYAYMDYSGILRMLGFFLHFGTLLPIAACGFWLTWADRPRMWVLYLFLLVYAFGILPFFVFARYRQIMLPVLIPFASAGLVVGLRRLREKRLKHLLGPAALALLIAVFSNWPVMSRETVAANTYYNWGSAYENRDRLAEAERFYRRAIQLYPSHVFALNNLGIISCRQGDFLKGIEYFQQAIKINPNLPKSHNNLGLAFYSIGKPDKALLHFQKTVRIDPDYDPNVDYNIACIFALQNRVETALVWLQRAMNKGYANWDNVKTDKDLENIRKTPQFQRILDSAQGYRIP